MHGIVFLVTYVLLSINDEPTILNIRKNKWVDNSIGILLSLIGKMGYEIVQFRRTENNFDFDDIGKYFWKLDYHDNLREVEFAWLIFGYDKKKHSIVDKAYKNKEETLNNLKHDFSQHTTDSLTLFI